MRSLITLIAVGLLCGCAGTGPAKNDNPVVGPPPPRLPPDQIRRNQLAYAGQSSDAPAAEPGSSRRLAAIKPDRNLDQAKPTESGIQRVSLTQGKDADLPSFDDNMVVALVNDQPIFAGEVLAPIRGQLKKAEQQMRAEYGKQYKPEMVHRMRAMFIRNTLPRIVERKMLVLAARAAFKKQQIEGLGKAVDQEWAKHLEQMMEHNKVGTINELEALLAENEYDLDEHEAAFKDQNFAMQFISFKAHSKFEPTRKEMIKFYEEHAADYDFPARVHWQQLIVSDASHGGRDGAEQHLDKVVQELIDGADFTATVKKHGDGPKAANGGRWDWTVKGSLQNKEVEAELFSLPVGEMSGVIRVPGGFQIVQVLDRQDAGRQPFESQQKAIEARIKEELYKERATEAIREIREASIIKTVFDGDPAAEKPAAEGPGA